MATQRSMSDACRCADLHRLLANPRRLMMLWLLEVRERSVGELAHAVGASLQSTSQHLRLLREQGLVASRRDGQTIYYAIEGRLSPGTVLRLEPPADESKPAKRGRHPISQEKELSHV
jgi:DNA-binding transcriptional ArsR family regulator